MVANDFIIWLKGFLTGKVQLSKDEVKSLQDELNKVNTTKPIDLNDLVRRDFTPIPNMPMNPYVEPFPQETSGCKYPDDCGMPTIWHGVIPPTCQKCGLRGQQMDITCGDSTTANIKYNTSHVTGDLNEAQD